MGATPDVRRRHLEVNGVGLHVAEAGDGPLVVLVHGFPECAHSWRAQVPALAAQGYRVVAPDMRGYGGSDSPSAVADYSILHLTGDVVGVVRALGYDDAVVVGHDWGAMVAWQCALFRPDLVRGVVGLSVPFTPRPPAPPTELIRLRAGDRFFYMLYFQEQGPPEAELEADIASTMRRILYGGSGERLAEGAPDMDLPAFGTGFLDAMPEPEALPGWLRQEDLDTYVAALSRNGFRGPLNWYRNLDRNWALSAPWAGATVRVPAGFVAGDRDPVVTGALGSGGGLLDLLDTFVPDLRVRRLLPGVGHWVQQEAPIETNRALLDFLDSLSPR